LAESINDPGTDAPLIKLAEEYEAKTAKALGLRGVFEVRNLIRSPSIFSR
jgi:hypothetical protein